MSLWVGIEQLRLSPLRRSKRVPHVPYQLVEHVREFGPLEPVVVRTVGINQYEILTNVETWLAVQRAGQHRLPVEVRDDLDGRSIKALIKLSDQIDGSNPVAEAEDFAQAIERAGGRHGAIAEVARSAGRSRSYVCHALRLLALPKAVRDLLILGELKAGHGRSIASVTDEDEQVRWAERVVREGLSVRALEQLIHRPNESPAKLQAFSGSATRQPSEDPDIRSLERRITETLGSAAFIDHERGEFVIHYARSLEALDGILNRLGCASD